MQRGSGILLHISSLPSSFGIGDLGPTATAFADRLAVASQRYWQILPLNPTNLGAGSSPYFSTSALAGNPLLISLDRLVDDGLLNASDLETAPDLPENEVDFESVHGWKLDLLDRAFERWRRGSVDRTDFDSFCERESAWLEDYAMFMVIRDDYDGLDWTRWPAELRDREPGTLQRYADERATDLLRHKFLQFVFLQQWRSLRSHCAERGIQMIGDVPIYVALDSADVWSNPQFFKLDADKRPVAVSGVPPDYFSATGQLWNTPVYDWNELEKAHFSWWKERMRMMFSLYDIVRIDHFRGLVQYWEVPAGEDTAMNGTWTDVPTHQLFDTLIREFPNFNIIAEDLGLITDDVSEVMSRYGFPGMKVLLFAFGDDNPRHPYLPHTYPRNSVVYTGTHDTNTARGWWDEETDTEVRHRLFRYLDSETGPEDVHWQLIRLGLASVADMAIFPLQDLLGLGGDDRMNDPATASGNWKWRCTETQLDSVDWERMRHLTRVYGRDPR